MTIQELAQSIQEKVDAKSERLSQIDEKINNVKSAIALKKLEVNTSIEKGESDAAVLNTRNIRDMQDELDVLQKVRDDIISKPALSENEINSSWQQFSKKFLDEFSPLEAKLENAYNAYVEAINDLVTLKESISHQASFIIRIANEQNLKARLTTPISVELIKYWPGKDYLVKLNNVSYGSYGLSAYFE